MKCYVSARKSSEMLYRTIFFLVPFVWRSIAVRDSARDYNRVWVCVCACVADGKRFLCFCQCCSIFQDVLLVQSIFFSVCLSLSGYLARVWAVRGEFHRCHRSFAFPRLFLLSAPASNAGFYFAWTCQYCHFVCSTCAQCLPYIVVDICVYFFLFYLLLRTPWRRRPKALLFWLMAACVSHRNSLLLSWRHQLISNQHAHAHATCSVKLSPAVAITTWIPPMPKANEKTFHTAESTQESFAPMSRTTGIFAFLFSSFFFFLAFQCSTCVHTLHISLGMLYIPIRWKFSFACAPNNGSRERHTKKTITFCILWDVIFMANIHILHLLRTYKLARFY